MRNLFRVVVVLATLVIGPSVGQVPAQSAPKDWSSVVDFTNTGLNKFSAADAALLQVLSPERVKDPTMRARLQRQLTALHDAQTLALAHGATDAQVRKIASPAAVQTIDPGCQLTSSNPGGYDLCGYKSPPDVMSAFDSGRFHHMWAGVQENDIVDGADEARAWYKSVAVGLSSPSVQHDLTVQPFQYWRRQEISTENTLWGSRSSFKSNCAPCYDVGVFHSTAEDAGVGYSWSTSFTRDSMSIDGTSDITVTDNFCASGWWYRDGGYSYWEGDEFCGPLT